MGSHNKWRNEGIMEEKMRVLEGPGKIDQFCKKKKVAPHGGSKTATSETTPSPVPPLGWMLGLW